jgi:UDP-N-acetylmuramoyl-L-alanyl-D-glutamate--2,6-diaminopimelate ligase
MKDLSDILNGVEVQKVIGDKDRTVASLALDSREVKKDGLFAAIPGTNVDGHQFIDEAIEKGARTILCEEVPEKQPEVTYLKTSDSAETLGYLADRFFDRPSRELTLIGVTGTNGKTTTVHLLQQLFRELGYKTGMMATIHYQIGEEQQEATHTTPHSIIINRMLH